MFHKLLHLTTTERVEFCNLTHEIKTFIAENRVKNGLLTVTTLHTTTAIYVNEDEPGLKKDAEVFFSQLFPENSYYHHDDFSVRKIDPDDEYKDRKNGFAHLKAQTLGHDITTSIIDGKLTLGKWQSVMFLDFDGPRKDRKVELIIHSETVWNSIRSEN